MSEDECYINDGPHRWGTGRDRDECADCDAPRPGSATYRASDYADALARRNLDLPAPDGRDSYGSGAWWLLSCGSMVMAHPGAVHGLINNDPRCLDGIEQDAYAALAAVAWARGCGEC